MTEEDELENCFKNYEETARIEWENESIKFPKKWPYYVNSEGEVIHPSEIVTEENEMTSDKERDEILSKQVIKAELKGGYITDEEADIKLRKLEDYHIEHVNDEFPPSRPILSERWDLLPAIALREVAKIMYKGQDKHPQNDWKDVDFNSEQSPLNRAIAHAYAATEEMPHTALRIQQLSKAACRLLMQIWWELQDRAEKGVEDEDNS